jgi:hypothetical protein
MKDTLQARDRQHANIQPAAAGRHGVALRPPSYGIAFIDRGFVAQARTTIAVSPVQNGAAVIQRLDMDPDDRHPDPTTAGHIDQLDTFEEVVSDEFLERHVRGNAVDAKTKATARLVEDHYIPASTVLIMNQDDKDAVRDEILYRNHIEFFGQGGGPYRCAFPLPYVTATRGVAQAAAGEGHFTYNMAKNGRVWILAHYDSMQA